MVKKTFHIPFIALCVFYLGTASALLIRFPPINPDEILIGVAADNYIHGKGPTYSLNDDIFAASAYALHDVTNQESRLLYMTWVGLWARCFPHNYIALRWSSLSLGFGALIFLYATGIALEGPSLGMLLVGLILTYPVFWASSLCVNEYIALFFASTGLVWLAVTQRPIRWRSYILGTAAGICIGIHPNIIPFFLGWTVLYLSMESWNKPLIHATQLALGFSSGVILAFSRVSWPHFLLYQKSLYWYFIQPPVLSWPWHPIGWFRSTFATLFQAPTYYFNSHETWGWPQALVLFWSGTIISLAYGFMNRNRALASWLAAFGITLIGMMLFVRRQEMAYGLTVTPFLIPLIGICWRPSFSVQQKTERVFTRMAGGCFAAALACFFLFANHSVRKTQPFDQITRDVQSLIPTPPGNIVGPNFLWLIYGAGPVRDMGALIVSRYYTDGRWNLQESFKTWKPDILFVNDQFKRNFIGAKPLVSTLLSLLGASTITLLGHLETFSTGESFDLYSIKWPPSKVH